MEIIDSMLFVKRRGAGQGGRHAQAQHGECLGYAFAQAGGGGGVGAGRVRWPAP
jgi:hypothetical protein